MFLIVQRRKGVSKASLDQFLQIWTRGLAWLEQNGKFERIENLWALAGSTVLADCYWKFAYDSSYWYEQLLQVIEPSSNLPNDLVERFRALQSESLMKAKPPELGLQIGPQAEDNIKKWLEQDGWPKAFMANARKGKSNSTRSTPRTQKTKARRGKP